MQTRTARSGWGAALVMTTLTFGCELLVDPDPDYIDWDELDRDGEHADGAGGNPEPGCEAVLCIEGTVCIDGEDGPECVPIAENPCNLLDCPPEQTCTVRDGEAVCAPLAGGVCGDASCGAGTYCDDISGEPQCLPLPSCEDIECAEDEICKLLDAQCFREPCPPQPSCVPAHGVPCGTTHCDLGQVCCNPSCGICTEPDGFCTEQYCGQEP